MDSRRGRKLLALILVAVLAPVALAVGAARKGPSLKVSVVAPKTLKAGSAVAVTAKVRNAGKAKAKAAKLTFALSRDARRDASDTALTGTLAVKALRKGKSVTVKGRITVPKTATDGAHTLLACVAGTCRATGRVTVTGGRKPAVAPAATGAATNRSGGGAPAGLPPARPTEETKNLPPAPGTKPGNPDNPTPPPPDPKPADPAKVAPKLDPGASTSVYDATKFLFSGDNPIQREVKAGAIDDDQVAVLKGRVTDRTGKPIEGVRVTVVDRPELGMTNTRATGEFDMAVNGGNLVLEFATAGFLPVQRTIEPNWQDYEAIGDVVMVPVDPNVETIEADSDEPIQVVQGSSIEDKDGERQGTLLFEKGTDAVMELPDGTTKPLDDINVRVTEFTYGSQGDEAMPGSLPNASGYTYAAEYSVDEALKAGATEVRFDKPVVNYTENFIGAPVGSPVPTGYYDREDGEWKASDNGVVIEVVNEVDGRAGVDVDGDGQAEPAGSQKLTELGIDDAERQKLAELYNPGLELWRVLIKHFTPWDHNWPFGPPPGAKPPKLKDFEWGNPNDPCQQQGSSIGCETQTLGEALPVTGTGMHLAYSTDRTPAWKVDETIDIPITGGELPPRLKGIQLLIDVAGERIEKRWCDPSYPTQGAEACAGLPLPAPNITHRFRWDGLDAYDRKIQGRISATIRVLYIYEFNYYEADEDFEASFSQFGSDTQVFDGRGACGNRLMGLDAQFFCGIPIGQTITRAIGSWDARPTHALGGWSLSEHHAYDPLERSLHRGDGTTVRAEAMPPAVSTIVGTTRRGVGSGPGENTNFPKDGEAADEANTDYLTEYTRAPDGSIYLHNSLNRNHVFKVGRDDKISHFAGNGNKTEITGDGGPAKSAGLGTVSALAGEADGSLLIAGYTNTADRHTQTIRRVSPDGSRIQTIAGNTNRQAPLGDGKPALEAHVGDVEDMIVAPDGSIIWGEEYSATNGWKARIRKIGPDGIVTTIAGGGTLPSENGNPAKDVGLEGIPRGIAMGPDGSIYAALDSAKKVIRIAADGRVFRFAGKGVANERGEILPGGPATQTYIDTPWSVAVAPDGQVYIRVLGYDVMASDSAILRVNGQGIIEHAAGRIRGTCGSGANGETATSVCMQNHAKSIGVDGDGGLTFADGRYLIRKVHPPLPGFDTDSLAMPSADGTEVYEFDRNGRHLRTKDAMTGQLRRAFEYDGAKRLTAIVDAFGNRTTIERDGSGKATAIVAPGGQRTTLGMDGAGWLEWVKNPAGEEHRFTYHDDGGGLLASYRRPEGGTTRFDYDGNGRLTKHRGMEGEERTLTRTSLDNGHRVTIETKGGRKTKYTMEVLSNGDRKRTIEEPSGAITTVTIKGDGKTVTEQPDGTKTTTELGPDPRWGSRVGVLRDTVVESPGGKKLRTRRDDTVTLRDPKDPFSLQRWTVNVKTSTPPASGTSEPTEITTWTWEAGSAENLDDQTAKTTSSEGRSTTDTLDRYGRVTRSTLGRLPDFTNVAPVDYEYDEKGRLKRRKQGPESETLTYDAKNRVETRANAAGETVRYTYDDADRVLTKTLPGDKVYAYEYDDDGAITKITTPRGKVHTFDATTGGRKKSYTPPAAAHEGPVANPAQYVQTYSTETDLESVKLPSGAVQDNDMDAAGRLIGEDHVQTKRTFGYDGGRDKYGRVTRKLADGSGEQSIDYAHDGMLPKSLEFTGVATGKAEFTFGERLLPTEEKLTVGATTVTRALEHDGDDLRTKEGPFTITRNGPLGATSKISDGTSHLEVEYDALGRPATRKVTVGGAEKFWQKLTFNSAARAEKRDERVNGGAQDTLSYEYDALGQLRKVKRGTTTLEDYGYDDGGNRTTTNGKTATFDDQDRLTAFDGKQYRYDADGFMVKRGTDTFTWSRSGELLSATIGGATVTYTYDAFGRRTARTDANGTTKYLYGNPGNMLLVTASVDAAGVVSSYFYDSDDRLYAIERDGARYFVGSDQLGSPRIVVKASDGTVARRMDYDAFGVERNATGSFDLPIGYAGGLRDGVTGLVRFGQRDYDPVIGRFVARDPSFFRGSPENLYAYVGNNPITQKDPTGLVCGGWSMYAVVGGGIQLCRDNKWDAVEADWSFCVEAGAGGGGGAELDIFQGAQDPYTSIVAEATGKAGIFSGTIGGELVLDCLSKSKATAKVTAGPLMIGNSTNDNDENGGLVEFDLKETKLGAKLEGKIAAKKCWKW